MEESKEFDCPVGNSKGRRCNEADRAADVAVQKTFAILGVDVNQPREVRRFQEDLRFNRTMKTFVDKIFIAATIASIGGFGAWIWELIKRGSKTQ